MCIYIRLNTYIFIFTIPWAKACFVIGQFCFLPFGKEVISRKKLTGEDDVGTGTLGLIVNIVWVIFAGIWLCIAHVISAIFCFITIIIVTHSSNSRVTWSG